MLNKETIIANDSLKDLSDEQIKAIETLSRNDEDAVIGARFGEVYRQMDETIEKNLGVKRQGDEKTYHFLERAAKEFSGKFADYDNLKGKITELEDKIAKGGDEALKAQLETSLKELSSTKEQYNTLKSTYDKSVADHEKALNEYKIDSEISRAKEGIVFKNGFTEAVLNTLIAQAVSNIKAKNPSFEERDGVQRLVFHDENGSPLNNAENKLNPFTAKELLVKEFEAMDILEKKPAKGAGGSQPKPKEMNLISATTQLEANEIINKTLASRGISKTDLRYQAEFDKLFKESNVAALPLR